MVLCEEKMKLGQAPDGLGFAFDGKSARAGREMRRGEIWEIRGGSKVVDDFLVDSRCDGMAATWGCRGRERERYESAAHHTSFKLSNSATQRSHSEPVSQ